MNVYRSQSEAIKAARESDLHKLSRDKLIGEIEQLRNINKDFKATRCRANISLIISGGVLLLELGKVLIEKMTD